MNIRWRARDGVALFAALALMALIALLIGGALALTTLAQRSARLSHSDAMLVASAELGLNAVLSEADRRGIADLPLGVSESYENVSHVLGVDVTVVATRLPAAVVWIVSEARLVATNARRRISVIARWPVPGVRPPAALVARGSIRVDSRVSVVVDSSGEADCRVSTAMQAVIAPGARIVGDAIDTTRVARLELAADSSTYYLAAWQRALVDSSPNVVHVIGDTTIAGGTFDGVLLVDGDLTILGSLTATGLIIARGTIDVARASINLTGAMLSFATPPTGLYAIDVADGVLRYSPCTILHAWRRSLSLRSVRHRSWAEVF